MKLQQTKCKITKCNYDLVLCRASLPYLAPTKMFTSYMVVQGAAEWTPIFQRVTKNEKNNLQ